ncbi:MAG: hypothetical protein V4596_00765 [Bdellovibrionota bacterium]
MNIKNVLNSLVNISGVDKAKLDHKTKLDASGERDTDLGRGEEEASKHKMTDTEAQEVLSHLKELDGIKDNNLEVRLEKKEDTYVVYIEDNQGKVVRRIAEAEMWFIYQKQKSSDGKKGQLINKAM